jgi:hypothetical protein
MLGLLDHSPDMFLDEIQDQLFHQHGIDISLATISRTLKRLGISSKKVCNDASQTANPFHNHALSFPKLQQNVAKKPDVNFAGKLAKSLQSASSLQTKVLSTFSRLIARTDGPSKVHVLTSHANSYGERGKHL